MLTPLHVTLHAGPPTAISSATRLPVIRVAGCDVAPLNLSSADLQGSFGVSFEDAAEFLSRLARLYFEPDGSFVWVGDEEGDGSSWQFDGVLYDRGGRLQYVELKGDGPLAAWQQLRAILGPPGTLVVAHFVYEGRFVDLDEWLKSPRHR